MIFTLPLFLMMYIYESVFSFRYGGKKEEWGLQKFRYNLRIYDVLSIWNFLDVDVRDSGWIPAVEWYQCSWVILVVCLFELMKPLDGVLLLVVYLNLGPLKEMTVIIVYFCFHALFSAFGKSRDIKLSRSLNMILFLFADQITCLGGGFLWVILGELYIFSLTKLDWLSAERETNNSDRPRRDTSVPRALVRLKD